MSKRDFRTVNMTDGQMVEADKVLKRIGDVNYRNIGALSKMLYGSNGLMVSSGLTVSPLSGMNVTVAEGKGIQGTAESNFPFLMTSAQTLTLEAASGIARIDIIEMQVQERAVKNDFSKAIINSETGEISTQTVKRDIQYFPAFQVKTGTTTPTPATAGTLIGTASIIATVDLSAKYLLNICDGEDSEFIEVNIQGETPEATTKDEIVDKINAAIGRTIASISGNYIVFTGNGTGVTSYFELKPPTSNTSLDALSLVFGLSSSGVYRYSYRGTNEWVKICEIDIGASTTTITSAMIRDISQKYTWASNSISFASDINQDGELAGIFADIPSDVDPLDKIVKDFQNYGQGERQYIIRSGHVNSPSTTQDYRVFVFGDETNCEVFAYGMVDYTIVRRRRIGGSWSNSWKMIFDGDAHVDYAHNIAPTIYTGSEDFLEYATRQRVARFSPGHPNAPNDTDWFTTEWVSAYPASGVKAGTLIARAEASFMVYTRIGMESAWLSDWNLDNMFKIFTFDTLRQEWTNICFDLLGNVYVSDGNYLYKSTDQGKTITTLSISGVCSSICCDPSNNVYAAVGTFLYKSINGGSTFSVVSTDVGWNKMCFDPSGVLYATKANGSYDIYKSTDGGVTFTGLGQNNSYYNSICCDKLGNIYVENSTNIYKSTDKGVTFSPIFQPSGGITFNGLACDRKGVLYFSMYKQYYGGNICRSLDGGTTFSPITTFDQGNFNCLSISADSDNTMHVISSSPRKGWYKIVEAKNINVDSLNGFNGNTYCRFPDYSRSHSVYGNTTYTALTNGWLVVKATNSYMGNLLITIQGTLVVYAGDDINSNTKNMSFIFPLHRGQTYKFEGVETMIGLFMPEVLA